MEITDVRVRLVEGTKQKVRAFCTVTLDDCFVVKDIKVIEGDKGEFIAMPSRKLSEKCSRCGRKNPIGSSFCSSCGVKVSENRRAPLEGSLYSDIAHPINAECRAAMQDKILKAYRSAVEESAPVAEFADEGEGEESAPAAESVPEVEVEEVEDKEESMGNVADPPDADEDSGEPEDIGNSFGEGIR